MADKRIGKIFRSDQKDRINKKDLVKNDAKRLMQLERILSECNEWTGEEYYMIAMVYHHGPTIEHIKQAKIYARQGMKLGNDLARWLYAAATDRVLLLQGKEQRYGTQWQMRSGTCVLWPVDAKTTDRTRARYGIEPLNVIKADIKEKNKRR